MATVSGQKRLRERDEIDEDVNARRPRVTPSTTSQHPQNVSTQGAAFIKQGSTGRPIKLTSNYFEVTSRPDFPLLQYRVDFIPEIELIGIKKALVRGHQSSLGQYIFDGTILYTTRQLDQPLELVSRLVLDNSEVKLIFKITGEVQKNDASYIAVMNIILRRCMSMLNLTEIRRDYFDLQAAHEFPQHRLKVAPGFFSTIRFHDCGLLLGVELIHKIIRCDTALDVITSLQHQPGNWKLEAKNALEGQIVMCTYNSNTYKIDDVDFDKNPLKTFYFRRENREITFKEYFKKQYNVDIINMNQPLLVSLPSRRDRNRGDNEPIFLIPELSGMTGFAPEQRNKNFRMMKDVATVTKLSPARRVDNVMGFLRRLKQNAEVKNEMISWGLQFGNELVECPARILPPKTIIQCNPTSFVHNGDWSTQVRRNKFFVTVDVTKWMIIYPVKWGQDVKCFVDTMTEAGGAQNFQLPPPIRIAMESDRLNDYLQSIENGISKHGNDVEIIMVVVGQKRADVYNGIKQLTLVQLGIPSQMLTMKTVGDQTKMVSCATKMTIQIAAKLGAVPWCVQLPNSISSSKWMVCGFDVYHDAKQSRAVGAFVSSFNEGFTRYSSSVELHENNEEISSSFYQHVIKSLKTYYQKNDKRLPEKIIVYRDGVSAGDIHHVKEAEIGAIKKACRDAATQSKSDYVPAVAFIVVTKNINSRFFYKVAGNGMPSNPECGTVVDSKVTLAERYDFFLVSQKANQGSVSPTSYNIIEDETRIAPDVHQILSNCLTDVYWNWAGSIRLPTPVQYAHKLAYLVGESLMRKPHDNLSSIPYYL